MSRVICYFVDDISTSFVINDIRAMSLRFDKVVLFSVDQIDDTRELPCNVLLIDNFMDWNNYNKIKIISKNILSIVLIYFAECYALKKILPFKKTIALLSSNIFKCDELQRQLRINSINLQNIQFYYSFWFYDSIYLAFLKRLFPSIKIITRAHSGDLYEDHISSRDRILMRHFQLSQMDAVYPVSEMGTAYLQKLYPKFRDKIKTIFLGTEDWKCINPFDPNNFVIVSCASFRHHKRIHKIAEALLEVDKQVTWYHFGNENLHTSDPKIPEYLERKEALKSKSNIKFIPLGYTENFRVLEFYKNQSVSLFVSLSAAEGIPVSIMEAISFGIPVLSTDVGGCAEIVNDSTGILIPLNTKISEVTKILNAFPNSIKNTEAYRKKVRDFWKLKFDANKNYSHFFEILNIK